MMKRSLAIFGLYLLLAAGFTAPLGCYYRLTASVKIGCSAAILSYTPMKASSRSCFKNGTLARFTAAVTRPSLAKLTK
jgi:hypothetical protein